MHLIKYKEIGLVLPRNKLEITNNVITLKS